MLPTRSRIFKIYIGLNVSHGPTNQLCTITLA